MMIKLRNEFDDYLFTKVLDDEDMDMRIVHRLDSLNERIEDTNVVGGIIPAVRQFPEFQKLRTIVENFCKESSEKVQEDWWGHRQRNSQSVWNKAYIQTQYCNAMWGVRQDSGQITTPHDHWPTTWSFVYYIDPPEGCSDLFFPTLDYSLEVEHGKLVIFRSHLIHETVSVPFEGYRYCVAGTVVFKNHTDRTISTVFSLPER